MAIPYLASTAANAEASQIVGTINGVIQDINEQALIGSAAPTSLRNAVIGGDFGTNPWQRTQSFTSITNTLTYTADRFWAIGGASSSISVSKQTSTPVPGFLAHARFGRASGNTDTAAIKFGQVLTSNASARFQGLPFVLSFYARAGATYSAASSVLNVAVGSGTGTDETAANFASGAWTGYATAQLTNSAGVQTTGLTLTTAFARYVMAGVIPATATQVGFNLAYTPVGTASTTDYIEVTGVQLEVMPQGGVQPTPFEWRPGPLERALCQAYFYRIDEPSANTKVIMGQANTATVVTLNVQFPVTMRSAPTTSSTATTTQIGSFTLTAPAGTSTSSLSSFAVTAGSPTINNMNLTATLSANSFTAGQVSYLIGAGGTGSISASAEL